MQHDEWDPDDALGHLATQNPQRVFRHKKSASESFVFMNSELANSSPAELLALLDGPASFATPSPSPSRAFAYGQQLMDELQAGTWGPAAHQAGAPAPSGSGPLARQGSASLVDMSLSSLDGVLIKGVRQGGVRGVFFGGDGGLGRGQGRTGGVQQQWAAWGAVLSPVYGHGGMFCGTAHVAACTAACFN